MSGHSKWSNIKHRKAAVDAKRGKIFTKIIRELNVAARKDGGDPETNPALRAAITNAKNNNMPNDTIERAIKRGTGEIGADDFQEITYEGYGPGGSAVLVRILTDNRNRTVSEVRRIFTKFGGNLGESGCVAWMFEMKGKIAFDKESTDEDQLFEAALEAGADDVKTEGNEIEVITDPGNFDAVKNSIEEAGFKPSFSEVTMIPKNTTKVEGKEAEQMLKLMEALDDSDDVQNVYSNFDIPDEIFEMLEAQG
ncbi:MAG: YebC/PmpR family DNA-binding transcriptional regulator [Thermodesulfobacteriota bacterium]